MRNLVFIIFSIIVFVACSPGKRIQRIAEKHGEHVVDTLRLDTTATIPEFHFDTMVEKEISIDTNEYFVDTIELVLDNGTKIQIIDSTKIIRSPNEEPEKLKRKRVYSIDQPEKEIPIKMDLPYDKIEVNPPDKIDVLLSNFKWAALMALAIALIITTLRKLFQ